MNEILSKEELIDIININLYTSNNKFATNLLKSNKFHKSYPLFKKSLIYYTNFLDKESLLSERVYCIINGITNKILCKSCKSPLIFIDYSRGYRKYCSRTCAYKSKNRIDNGKKTLKERYGKNNPMQIEQFKENHKKSITYKYGVNNVFQLKKVKEKIRNTNYEKYGTYNKLQSHINNFDKWIDDKSFIEIYNEFDHVDYLCTYFNVTFAIVYRRARSLNLPYKPRKRDITIKNIGKIIEQYGYNIEYNNRSIIKPLEIDIILRKNSKIVKALEYNGLMFHSLGISKHKVFNNWDKYRDNLSEFINKDRIKLDKCRELNIELLILREDIYLNNPNIIGMWLNGKLNYKILNKPIIYRFKNVNNLEITSIDNIEDSIDSGYRIYFDWIEFI